MEFDKSKVMEKMQKDLDRLWGVGG